MQAGQQQAAAQQPHAQLGNPDLQKNLLDQLHGTQHYLQAQATHTVVHMTEKLLLACLLKFSLTLRFMTAPETSQMRPLQLRS